MTKEEIKQKHPEIGDYDIYSAFEDDPSSDKHFAEWIAVQHHKVKQTRQFPSDFDVEEEFKFISENESRFKDINSYNSFEELKQAIDTVENNILSNECELLIEDNGGKFVFPKTESAFRVLSKNTRWDNDKQDCVQAVRQPYYVLVDDEAQVKYLFNLDNKIFVDNRNYNISWAYFKRDYPEVFNYIITNLIPNIEFDIEDLIDIYGTSSDEVYEAVKKELLNSGYNENNPFVFRMDGNDLLDVNNRRDTSPDFIDHLINGTAFEYFDNYYEYSDEDVIYYIRYLNEDVLSDLGVDRKTLEKIVRNEDEFEDVYTDEQRDNILGGLNWAISDAVASGSYDEAYSDFKSALESALPTGCTYYISDEGTLNIKVDIVSLLNSREGDTLISTIIDNLNYYSSDIYDCFEHSLAEQISSEFDFDKPYNGWSDFYDDVFNEVVIDRLTDAGVELPLFLPPDLTLEFDNEDNLVEIQPEQIETKESKENKHKQRFKKLMEEFGDDWTYQDSEKYWAVLAKEEIDYQIENGEDGELDEEELSVLQSLPESELKNLYYYLGDNWSLSDYDWENIYNNFREGLHDWIQSFIEEHSETDNITFTEEISSDSEHYYEVYLESDCGDLNYSDYVCKNDNFSIVIKTTLKEELSDDDAQNFVDWANLNVVGNKKYKVMWVSELDYKDELVQNALEDDNIYDYDAYLTAINPNDDIILENIDSEDTDDLQFVDYEVSPGKIIADTSTKIYRLSEEQKYIFIDVLDLVNPEEIEDIELLFDSDINSVIVCLWEDSYREITLTIDEYKELGLDKIVPIENIPLYITEDLDEDDFILQEIAPNKVIKMPRPEIDDEYTSYLGVSDSYYIPLERSDARKELLKLFKENNSQWKNLVSSGTVKEDDLKYSWVITINSKNNNIVLYAATDMTPLLLDDGSWNSDTEFKSWGIANVKDKVLPVLNKYL